MGWTFNEIVNGEGVFDRWCRLFDTLLSQGPISIGQHGDTLRAFLDIISTPGAPVGFVVGKPVSDVAPWRTNCAMTMHAAQVWCGRFLRPYNNGQSIEQYVELRRGGDLWVPNDGKSAPTPWQVQIFYVGPSAHLGFDHVGGFGRPDPNDPRHFNSYEGGGGDGTKIGHNDRHLDKPDSYGRRIEGWWEIGALLDPSQDVAPHSTEDEKPQPTEAA